MTEDRAAVVVGGAGGIGGGISRRLAADGYRVTIADRDLARAEEVVTTLAGEGHAAAEIDVLDERSVDESLNAIEARQPSAVLVVASGGPVADLRTRPTVATLSTSDWTRTVDLNLTGVFLVIRKFAQQRTAQPLAHSRIITISSASGLVPQDVIDIAYVSSKAAIFGLTRQAAFDLAAAGVTVNAIAPGVVGTPAFLANTTPEVRAATVAGQLVNRLGTPEEIGAAVAYLASREAGYVTGATLNISGGVYMD